MRPRAIVARQRLAFRRVDASSLLGTCSARVGGRRQPALWAKRMTNVEATPDGSAPARAGAAPRISGVGAEPAGGSKKGRVQGITSSTLHARDVRSDVVEDACAREPGSGGFKWFQHGSPVETSLATDFGHRIVDSRGRLPSCSGRTHRASCGRNFKATRRNAKAPLSRGFPGCAGSQLEFPAQRIRGVAECWVPFEEAIAIGR